ncbi:MAG: sulfotransferase [Desulfobacterales bacterium]|jgi:hypothetical protein
MDNVFVFIVGSPRSGTTILGEMLDRHRQISQWYEPYFVWDRCFRRHPHDERSRREATPRVINQIRHDFYRYREKSGSRVIVDKSPRNSLKIPFIKTIFPQAQFIHLIRDGRDVTLSIHKEWRRRMQILNDPSLGSRFNHRQALKVVRAWISKQPFLQDKIRALWFETHGHFIDHSKHLNRTRWNGRIGWGPRFRNWEHFFNQKRLLQFNAYQWLKCVAAVHQAWDAIPTAKKLEIRYEEMIKAEQKTLARIIDFIGLTASDRFLGSLPQLKRGNTNKWAQEFTNAQMSAISPILNPMLERLGYLQPEDCQTPGRVEDAATPDDQTKQNP